MLIEVDILWILKCTSYAIMQFMFMSFVLKLFFSHKTSILFFFGTIFIVRNNNNLIRSFNTIYKSRLSIKDRELALESFLGKEIVIKKALSVFLKIRFLYFLIFS